MNILIISTNRNAYPVPVLPYGACMAAEAAERAGHRVSFLDLMFKRDPAKALKDVLGRATFDLVGLSVRNIDNIDMASPRFFIAELAAFIEIIRSATDAFLVLGGASLSVMPEEIMRAAGVSCAVVGDGDVVFPRLIEKLSRSEPWQEVPGVASLTGGQFRLNPFPAPSGRSCFCPDYHCWLDLKAYRSHLATVPIRTKQGCGFACVYCTYRRIEGSAYRLSDPAQVADAAVRLAKQGIRDIEFVDNVFNVPYDHAVAVCESLIRTGSPSRLHCIELSPHAFDQPLLSLMERAGFVGMGLTAESAADPVLQGLGKGFTARHVHAAADTMKRSPMPCLWIFMLGGPGETRETVRETLRFAEASIRPQDAVFFTIGVRIYPETELETIARRQGVLALPRSSMLEPVFYVSPEVDAGWIRAEVKQSMRRHMNFMDGDSMSFAYLPRISRLGHRLGLTPPLWRYTRFIRRGLRLAGMDV